jgi:rod shape determining protein RodA
MFKISKISKDFDYILLLMWFILVLCGIFLIYTASTIKFDSEIIHNDFFLKQIFFVIISIFLIFIIQKIPVSLLDFLIYPSYYFVNILLILVLFTSPINNSTRWFKLGFLSFQPSELAKIIIILLNAKILSKKGISNFSKIIKPAIYMVFPVILMLREPDLGAALIICLSFFVMLPKSGFPVIYLVILMTPLISIITSFYLPAFIIFAILLIFLLIKQRFATHLIAFILIINIVFLLITPVLWAQLKPYQQNRIITFIDPSKDPLNTGYQVIQAKIAVGSGQLFGKGFLMGTQKNMNFVPDHHTDFIFSVAAEEFGFIGASALVILFMLFFLRIIKNIYKSEFKERQIAMVGFLGFMFFQVLINVGMNLGLCPTTGIALPFISYGGSSIIANSVAIALILKYSENKDI